MWVALLLLLLLHLVVLDLLALAPPRTKPRSTVASAKPGPETAP